MSVDYFVYTEANVKGKWECIDSYILNKEGKFKLAPTYWNGSRTYFSDAADEIRSAGRKIKSEELSEILAKEWPDDDCIEMLTLSFGKMRELTAGGKGKLCGFVPKNEIRAFEEDGREIDEWIGIEEYESLSEEGKKFYKYYEWNDPYGWRDHFEEIERRVQLTREKWENVTYHFEDDLRIILMCCY